ncbi:hypothetical protein BDV41DRAFT_533504 [Aspergillus transmontanensis]|uniref:Uncharacterized protein n=1 Tax=Aspergillus transmontanensis TaxID=1034304 RepID=A0A5N6W4C2_9EURO|nr:hypothetical protein BDV41DRAFT_533504 [Aspergillus transmontanensis]
MIASPFVTGSLGITLYLALSADLSLSLVEIVSDALLRSTSKRGRSTEWELLSTTVGNSSKSQKSQWSLILNETVIELSWQLRMC